MAQTKEKKLKPYAVLIWLLIWEMGSRILNQEILLVSPFSVVKRLSELLWEPNFYHSILNSVGRIVLGFLFAECLSFLAMNLSRKYSFVEDLLEPFVFTIRATPVASFTILILVWVPSRNLSVVIAFLMAFPVLYEGFRAGIQNCDRDLLEMAKVFGIPKWERYRTIWLSAVLPFFKSSSVTALGLCWKAGIAAEVIGIPKASIGEKLYNAKVYLDMPDLFAWTVVIILLSILFQRCFELMLDRMILRIEREL